MQLQEKPRQAQPEAPKEALHTPEQYLALEEIAETKSEYHDGLIIPMTGGTTNHNQIALNISMALGFALKKQDYRVYVGDVRLWLPRKRRYVYPDVMVIAGRPEYHNNRRDTVTNPQVIIEVLSESTEDYDWGNKFRYYRSLPTFQEYVVIDQTEMYVGHFHKTADKQWQFNEYDGTNATLTLHSFEFTIDFPDIYDKVEFEAEQEA
jgi:Uma2 family endonuclease